MECNCDCDKSDLEKQKLQLELELLKRKQSKFMMGVSVVNAIFSVSWVVLAVLIAIQIDLI